MVNLKAMPFNLSDKDISWVENTINDMSLEEKIGQLFIVMDRTKDREAVKDVFDTVHPGGMRYINESAQFMHSQINFYQETSKIPLLVAANYDSGGTGGCTDGTHIATAAACGATNDTQTSYDVGYVSGREGTAMGCNWTYDPTGDILFNWRNTIVNTRAYGNKTQTVLENCLAYMDGVAKSNMASCGKHFPGDGVEELDQHLVMGINDLSCDDWDQSFGQVYKAMIDHGLQSIMVGHIALPEYSRKLRPGISDREIMPATLAPELLGDLLRQKLGFNGLIVSDASHMAGMTCAAKRKDQVPGAIAAGCDMFLYYNDKEEDFGFMLEGLRAGVITEERLHEALLRILGLKASLKLHTAKLNGTLSLAEETLQVVGCEEHLALAQKAAEKTITLVKDTDNNLPISPKTHKRICVYVLSSPPARRNYKMDPVREIIRKEMESFGYEVDLHDSFYDLELAGIKPENALQAIKCGSVKEFTEKYDAAFVFVNMQGYAQENNVRICYSAGHSNEIPWFVRELPTVCISLNYTNHLHDLPMMRTFINAYAPTRTVIKELIAKMAGDSAFEGKYNDSVFCGRWDATL